MRRPLLPFALLAAILPFPAARGALAADRTAGDPFTLRLLQGDLTPPAGDGEASLARLAERGAELARRGVPVVHALLQFERAPEAEERDALAAAGVELGDYATGNAWIAAVPSSRVSAALGRAGLRWTAAWDAARKLDPALARGGTASGIRHPDLPGQLKLLVQLHRDVPLDRLAGLAESLGGRALDPLSSLHGGTVWIPEPRLAALAESEEVLWIGPPAAPLRASNDGVLSYTGGGWVQSSLGLDGKGTRIFVYDAGAVEAKHPTFDDGSGSRVKVIDGSPVDDHSTHVAGTAAGDGSDDPEPGQKGRGMAPAASIFSAGVEFSGAGFTHPFVDNLGDLEKDYQAAVGDHDIDVANNSIGLDLAIDFEEPCGLQGEYGPYAKALDTIVRGDDPEIERPVILTWATGNERGPGRCGTAYDTTAPPSCAKNVISVGAIHSDGGAMTEFSSWGPCDDGRLAPTVVAPGDESGEVDGEHGIDSSISGGIYAPLRGTSMAAPGVTGALAQVIQDWRQRGFGGAGDQPLPALARALVVHSARDIGPQGPDYTYGYGSLDAKALIALERADDGKLGNGNGAQWGTDQLAKPSDQRTYEIFLGADLPSFRATLAWDDPAAAPFSNPSLVNDLTLELISPSDQVYKAWRLDPGQPALPATAAGNDLDNLEQVVVKKPEQGIWKVRVSAAKLPKAPQPFALAYTWTPQTYIKCFGQTWSFEGAAPAAWTFQGSGIEVVPDGSINHAVALAGNSTASFTLDLPAGLALATLELRAVPYTDEVESTNDFRDRLNVLLRDASTQKVLALLDQRDSGWPNEVWLTAQNLPLRSGKIEVDFVAKTDGDAFKTKFFVDDVHATWCPKDEVDPHFDVDSKGGGQDGFVVESSEESNAGGTAYPSSSVKQLIQLGDWSADEQVKGIVSFDTSVLPDELTITGAVLELTLQQIFGDNPHLTHSMCRIDVAEGFFGASPDLEPKDFEAPATHTNVSPLGYAADPADVSYANLMYQPWSVLVAPVNKTGLTQIRLWCDKDDDDDEKTDVARYYSGAAPAGIRPRLVIGFNP